MNHVLDDLFDTIESRKGGDPEKSYTARLLAGGTPLITRKLAEEAMETAIAALTVKDDEVVKESADVLYHLLALWALLDIEPEQVWEELRRRTGQSGLEEKASRPKS